VAGFTALAARAVTRRAAHLAWDLFVRAEELAYANSTKVLRTLRSIDAPVKLISERIPRDIAAKLGAKSLSQLLEEVHSHLKIFKFFRIPPQRVCRVSHFLLYCLQEFSELIGVEYGQEEKLTSRIANILHNYSHEDLLKELVQNAEVTTQPSQSHVHALTVFVVCRMRAPQSSVLFWTSKRMHRSSCSTP
jgi:hypothetical protein